MDETPNFDYEKGWENKGKKFLEFDRQLNHPVRKLIFEKAREVDAGSVLDIGCATCNDYPRYRNAGIRYYGRDITPKFIKRAKRRFPEIDVAYGNVLNLEEFSDDSVDVVYCKDLLEHLPPKLYRKAIRQMMRVASKRVMIAFFIAPWEKPTEYRTLKKRHWNNQYGKSDIMKALKKASKIEVVENIGHNNSALYVVNL